jgi:predicted TIM-barrel fold metal-dependent hydrolase
VVEERSITVAETTVRERQRERKERIQDILIVDCDVHVHESPGELAPYCDMPWRVALDHIKDRQETYLDIPSFSPGVSDGSYQAKFPTGHEGARMVDTKEQMREELDEIHVDIGILFPDHLLKLPVLTQVEYPAAIARAYNAWLLDKWCSVEKGLLGLIVACTQDPQDAAREIEKYAKEPSMVGVYLPCAGLDPLWGDRKYDPIYEAAQAADLPVLLHSVTVTHPVFPFNNHIFNTELGRHTCSHTFSIMANMVHMVTNGVMLRYPDLRIAVTEAGISWVPFLMWKLDKEYLERRREVPFLEERPSHYLKQWYYATQPIEEPENLRELATLMELYDGENNTIFASDWPHHDFDHPMKVHQIPLSNEARRKIFGENALRLFKIDAKGNRLNL